MNSHTEYWLLYKGMYHYLGLWKTEKYKQARADFLRNNTVWMCALCGSKTSRKSKTIDHIIPKSILYELELPHLIYDPRNFRLTCKDCNYDRKNDTSDLPLKVLEVLEKRRQRMLDNTETQPV